MSVFEHRAHPGTDGWMQLVHWWQSFKDWRQERQKLADKQLAPIEFAQKYSEYKGCTPEDMECQRRWLSDIGYPGW